MGGFHFHLMLYAVNFLLPSLISAHARITTITAGRIAYGGWDPEYALGNNTLPDLVAWSAENLGNIFVSPSKFATPNITCHNNAKPGALHAKVQADHTVALKWNELPTSHKGPVLTYLAPCNGSCTSVNKDQLKFVKIEEQGWLNASDPNNDQLGGTSASHVLIHNNFTWIVTIPPNLQPGNYVLRHEIIALHIGEELDGAQAYPQCINLEISKASGSREVPATPGIPAPTFYTPTDPGILVNIHGIVKGYQIPGPKLWVEAVPQPQSRKVRRASRLQTGTHSCPHETSLGT